MGPYVYWLFTEYQASSGPDARMQDWLDVLHQKWAVERQWKGFLQRGAPGLVGRTDTNGMLEISILAYSRFGKCRKPGSRFDIQRFHMDAPGVGKRDYHNCSVRAVGETSRYGSALLISR